MAEAKPGSDTTDPLLLQLAEANAGGSVRAPLAVWMDANHDAVAKIIGTGANWPALSKVWMANGMIAKPEGYDDPGKAGTAVRKRVAETCKRTWFRIHLRHKSGKGKSSATPSPAPVVETDTAKAGAGTPKPGQEGDETETRPKFGLAKSRS